MKLYAAKEVKFEPQVWFTLKVFGKSKLPGFISLISILSCRAVTKVRVGIG
jgi:hypothetical protein